MEITTVIILTISITAVCALAAAVSYVIIHRKNDLFSAILTQKDAELASKDTELARLNAELARINAEMIRINTELVRKEAELEAAQTMRENDRQLYEKTIAEMKKSQAEAIEAAKNSLALENEKALKEREESLRKEAAQTMKVITDALNKEIKDMKEAFEAQKKSHAEESSSIKTQFAMAVSHLKEQTDSIGNTAESLASALKGKNKMQGIFGETILENILKGEGLRPGHDYDTEVWLRDKKGNRIVNEDTGKTMRPDFALHFPDDTDILIDSKVSLTALADYFAAETDEQRADASRRNLESVLNHIKELTGKEYQKYVVGRKTLDYIIMFIPNYGAYQLARLEDSEIFAKAFRQNVLITTEETLIPFLRLIRTAWVQKEQMDNITEIVAAAQNMVNRVALFCEKNAEVERSLETALKKFRENSARLVDSDQSIVGAALKAVSHGIKSPAGRDLPTLIFHATPDSPNTPDTPDSPNTSDTTD